jgi:hypothetical protein
MGSAARAQTDVIRGRVTNPEGLPLQNVRVTATSIPGAVTRETRTDNRGAFQFVFAGGQGDYIMGYALIGYVFRQFEVKRTADQDVLLADARLSIVQLDTVSVQASVQQRVNRNSQTPDVSGTERQINMSNLPPELIGDLTAMAASLPGVLLVPGLDGGPDGFSVLGLGADQNSVTLNGMQMGSNMLPRDALISTSLNTSSYDVSRGGFSGANLNVRSGAGSNFRRRGMSLLVNTPQLEWTDRAAQSLGTQFTNLSWGGIASGPLVYNKSFYNLSYQLGRQSRDNQTLLTTDALGLATAGIAMDSVSRFVDILQSDGVPTNVGPFRPKRLSDNGSVFGGIDISPPNSQSGSSYGFNVNGNWSRQSPAGGGVSQLAQAGGDRMNWTGGLQGRHNAYVHMVLSETEAGVNMSRDAGEPYMTLPLGRVRVGSTLADGASGVQSLTFGGNQGLSSRSRNLNGSFQNTLSWFDNDNKHRIKLTTEAQYAHSTQDLGSNLLGTFTFNSLEDLENGVPASFSRTLAARRRSSGQVTGAVALGDSYRRNQDLQIQYGIRAEATHFTATPAYNPLVDATYGLRNDHVPTPVSLSPRIGVSWTLGEEDQIASFFGESRAPRAIVRAGLGVFTNGTNAGLIGGALDNTGLPSGAQQIVCVGPAVPTPDWAAYERDAGTVPDRCADGTTGTVFSNTAPNVTLFSARFRPQRTVRSNASWNGSVFGARWNANIEGTYSLNLNQQRFVDLNFNPVARFTLVDDARPVFVSPNSIIGETGTIASHDERVSPSFARVSEQRSDLQSRTAQLSVRLSPRNTGPNAFGWNLAYTYTHVREQVSGFNSTAANPLDVQWFTAAQGPHAVNYSLRYTLLSAVQVGWQGTLRSGSAFTPLVAGDVNGDGYNNDRAFIPTLGAATDSALAAGLQSLLATAPTATRECLERQMGTIASRNSCRGPWTQTASLNVTLDRVKFHMPQRGSIQFSLANPLGAADLALNGSGHLRGWGQTPAPDQSLLYVRGFDPLTRRFRYEVNQRFGATRPQFVTLRSPVTLTMQMKFDLGETRERQNLMQQLNSGRRTPGTRQNEQSFRNIGTNSLQNPMATILRQQDSLHLTATQADSIASMNRRYTYRSDSLWAPVARYFANLPADYNESEAHDRYIRARHAQIDLLVQTVGVVHDLLTPAQRRKLPQSVVNYLDARYLMSIRNGNGMYVSATGF